jgi:hypothetical protein
MLAGRAHGDGYYPGYHLRDYRSRLGYVDAE